MAAVGEPKRLARQLFAINDGFLGPIFFAWLGASLDLKPLGADPRFILLGLALGVGAILAHLVMRLFRQPASLGVMSAAQLGVPVAAATVGQQSGDEANQVVGVDADVAEAAGAPRAGRVRLPGEAPQLLRRPLPP